MKDVALLAEGDVNFSPARMEWYAQLDGQLQLSPPLIITREQWQEAIKILDRALTAV